MQTLHHTARITGLGYLIIFITGFFANFFILEKLVVEGDAAATTANMLHHPVELQNGIYAFVVMVMIDILLAYPLSRLVAPVDQRLSKWSAWLRLINGIIFGLALVNLFKVIHIIDQSISQAALVTPAIENQIMVLLDYFDQIWLIGLVFFGMHLLILGRLLFRSGYLPKTLGVLLQVAGIGYLMDSGAQFFLPGYDQYQLLFEMMVVIPGVAGEFSLTGWLLVKGTGTGIKESANSSDRENYLPIRTSQESR